ncbi:heavy metal-binding domain-containing protein [Desulfobacterales bacterium HSG16]|nr:heavy metal-binding domain-containing protein [Desulfobacterales bacterium HSG16]
MEYYADIIINFGLPVGFIILAMITGSILENRHFKNIEKREADQHRISILTTREYPKENIAETRMVSGSVVVSVDYFKRFLASLRNIFGGEVSSYCSLLDRGRREAILRMKEQWSDADLIVHLRVETSSISKGNKKSIGSTEVLAYGTGIRFEKQQKL